jgi:methylphosphotriester-DNA--protein-cysteine methyltransferase
MMRNTYILMIVQALLTLLLFFSEGYIQYATIGLILVFDLILFISLFKRQWSYQELFTLAAIMCSGIFVLFYVYSRTTLTTVLGILIVMFFIVLAILGMISGASDVPYRKNERIQRPEAPEYYYDVAYHPYGDTRTKKPEPVMHVSQDTQSPVKNKLAAKAVAYELEREAQQLKDAEKLIREMEIYNAERELLKEKTLLENAQKKTDIVNAAVKDAQKANNAAKELKKEAKEIMKVQKQISEISKLQQIEAEAKRMKKAETQIKELQFLNQQEKIVNQAKAIAKAQKDIDALKKKPSKQATVKVKTVKAKDESFYFSTETGNKFHEPGCIAIKKVPKNKLTLFTNKKEALKKGLQPCSVCIPK